MFCKECGNKLGDNDKFCVACGTKVEAGDEMNVEKQAARETFTRYNKRSIFIISAIILCIAVGVISVISIHDKDNSDPIANTTENESTQSSETKYSEKTTFEVTATKKETQTTKPTTTINAEKLYRPSSDKFCNQYTRYISGYFEGQSYAKMRFGPSKSKYNVVGQIDNGNKVTVETKSVDGWTLVYYDGKEGWVRTDFLFEEYDDCFPKQAILPDDYYTWSYAGYVDVTGEYDGEPLNMRSGPSRDYQLITTVPDGAEIEIKGASSQTDEWTYIGYNGYLGWVLTKYIIYCETGDKPVLYLYPEKETDVDVSVKLKNMVFTCTYPKYNGGWSVIAKPDGTLINKADNKEYSYLYWELGGKQNYDFSKGFVVKGSDTAEFLQSTLAEIGLTPKEYNEFIVYWLPKMQKNEYNLISFQHEEYTDNVQLNISPKPDSTLRVFMAYKALDSYVEIEPQTFEPFHRTGFTVVEWGGVEVK